MSRTDKDMPDHVRAEWWEAQHFRCPYATAPKWGWYPERGECDLPAEPDVRLHIERRQQARRQRGMCTWEPVYDRNPLPPPPRWYIGHVYHWPERQAARVDCLNAAKEYRGSGEVETIPTTRQARNCAQWYWW